MEEIEFGRYRLIEVIGSGGMGKVYRAHDTMMGRDVAVKVLAPEFAAEPGYSERFQREAETAARLTEPHILPIHETGEIDGRLYVVTPIIDGIDLHSLLRRDGPMTPQVAVKVVTQLASALDAAHAHGLVHRDVRPSNALMVGNGFVYLIDFSIAHDASTAHLTSGGSKVGAFAYTSPERLQGLGDSRADVYALACVLHECLTGSQPYPGLSIQEQIHAHMTLDPPRPSTLRPGIPASFDKVISRGMAKDPDQRYQTATELAAAARRALSARPAPPATAAPPGPVPHPAQPAGRSHRRTVIALIMGAVVLVAVVVAAVLLVPTLTRDQSSSSSAPASSGTTTPASTAYSLPASYDSQIVLPFNEIGSPRGVTVDAEGNVYATDTDGGRILWLRPGDAEATALPLAGLELPEAVAVDSAGTVYVANHGNELVLKLATQADAPTELPFGGLDGPGLSIAVDSAGTVYVADTGNTRVLKLAENAMAAVDLDFPGLARPEGLAVDEVGTIYLADSSNRRVVMLPAGASRPTILPFGGLEYPTGVAVDPAGTVYVTDFINSEVVMLEKGGSEQTTLPFTGLINPTGVAVDKDGSVYVADSRNDRVLKLPAAR